MSINVTVLPSNPYRYAAVHYRQTYGWATDAQDAEVWLRLDNGQGAVTVDQPLADRLRAVLQAGESAAPVIHCPGKPPYWVFLVTGPKVLDAPTRTALAGYGATYRGGRRLIDLPPTQSPLGELVWVDPPTVGQPFPRLATVLRALATAH